MTISHLFTSQIQSLLAAAGFSNVIHSIQCCKGGNNRTYRVETSDQIYAVKHYFNQKADHRMRLTTEFNFSHYANQAAPGMSPIPYYYDENLNMGLYEFIEGEKITSETLHSRDIAEASQFFYLLNRSSLRDHASHLLPASESCFSLQDHITKVGARVDELQHIEMITAEDQLAKPWITKLNQHWECVKNNLMTSANKMGMDLANPLARKNSCISPSDFGFHNAVRLKNGMLSFIDFEYAGWDDPAKMVGDFFNQLAVPVPFHYFDQFVAKTMQPFAEIEQLIARAKLLNPVYQIKWCCIALNVFVPMHMARKKFANPEIDAATLKKNQLQNVISLILNLEKIRHASY